MSKTRIQLRGTCPVCGKQHATTNGRMVAHGYTVQWNSQFNGCNGENKMHFGTEEGRDALALHIEALERHVSELPSLIEAQADRHMKARLSGALRAIPAEIESQKKRLSKWAPAELVEVDLAVEEAEQRKARQAAAEVKKAARQKAAEAKAAKAAEREAKSDAKWKLLCGENVHQVEVGGELVLEWIASYESRGDLEKDHGRRLSEHMATVTNNQQEVISAFWNATHRVRDLNTRKQLHKY